MVDVARTNTLERVARVLAGEEASINAHGSSSSAGDEVDAAWRDRIDDAVAVLKTLREPDEEMARAGDAAMRSEEHTSELQSLMRISYAVFCLKKKKITNN